MPRRNNRAAPATAVTGSGLWMALEEELCGTAYCVVCGEPIRADHARRGEQVHPWCVRGER